MKSSVQKWILAEYWATSQTLEIAQSALLEAGAIGLEIDDGVAPEGICAYAPDSIRLLAYFEPSTDLAEHIAAKMALFFSNCGFEAGPINFLEFLEDDWQGNFVRSCTTFVVEPQIFIVPSFEIEEFKKKPQGDLFIEMDPENAFGTGQHQTTKLCLKNICDFLHDIDMPARTKLKALDVGTGSAILAILLKKLGLGHVAASDTDADAIETARKNALRNDVILDLFVVSDEHIYAKDSYDLVIANILAPTLIQMADNLINTCVSGGKLILSGILLAQAPEVINAYNKLGASLVKQESIDDWCALVLLKK